MNNIINYFFLIMSKKTLSDLILNFDKSKKPIKGGYVTKTYEPAKQITTPIGKRVIKPIGNALQQDQVNYKQAYEQLIYKDLYKKLKPQPKDALDQGDFYKALLEYQKNVKDTTERPLTEKDIAEFMRDIGEYEPYEASESIPYVQKSRRTKNPQLNVDGDQFPIFPPGASQLSGYAPIRPRYVYDSDIVEVLPGVNPSTAKIPYNKTGYRELQEQVSSYRIPTKKVRATPSVISQQYSYNLPFAGSEYSNVPKVPETIYSYATPEQKVKAAPLKISQYASYNPKSSKVPYNIAPETIVPAYEAHHRSDNAQLQFEYENNPSNFVSISDKPKKEYLPYGQEFETFAFQSAEASDIPFGERGISEKIEAYETMSESGREKLESKRSKRASSVSGYPRGYNPESQKNVVKAQEAKREKDFAKKGAIGLASAPGVISTGIFGEGLKKKAQKKSTKKGGKISVGNLSKFFKSSYSGKKAPKKIDTYNLDSDLTNKYGSVYYDPDKNHAVLTHKGTHGDTFLETAKDWTNNAMYAVGLYKYTDRYKQGKKLQDATEKKYGANNVSTLGHSQGSTLSRELGQNSKEIINLNAAYKGEKPLKNEYNIRSSGDVVSVGLHGTNRGHDTLIPAESLNPLTEHGIDILDRIDQNQMIGQGLYNPHLRFRIPKK